MAVRGKIFYESIGSLTAARRETCALGEPGVQFQNDRRTVSVKGHSAGSGGKDSVMRIRRRGIRLIRPVI